MNDSKLLTEFRVVHKAHQELTKAETDGIIMLKSQHWNYQYDMQKEWIDQNLHKNDFHLWIETNENGIVAYLNMVLVECRTEGSLINLLGIGNVCVAETFKRNGMGLLLMQTSAFYIKQLDKKGILLCKDVLVPFYQKAGWQLFNGKVFVNDNLFTYNAMILGEFRSNEIMINRIF